MFEGYISFFGTKDLKANENFYKNLLGLKLYKDQKVCKIYEICDGSYIGFCEHMEITHSEKGPMLTFLTDKVDDHFKNLKEKNVEIVQEPKLNEKFQIYHFFLKDPDGYTVEIQKFINPKVKKTFI